MQVEVSGWFESDSGAVMFCVYGSSMEEAAQKFVAEFGSDAVGVDREAEVEGLGEYVSLILNGEFRFWRAVDRLVAAQEVA